MCAGWFTVWWRFIRQYAVASGGEYFGVVWTVTDAVRNSDVFYCSCSSAHAALWAPTLVQTWATFYQRSLNIYDLLLQIDLERLTHGFRRRGETWGKGKRERNVSDGGKIHRDVVTLRADGRSDWSTKMSKDENRSRTNKYRSSFTTNIKSK